MWGFCWNQPKFSQLILILNISTQISWTLWMLGKYLDAFIFSWTSRPILKVNQSWALRNLDPVPRPRPLFDGIFLSAAIAAWPSWARGHTCTYPSPDRAPSSFIGLCGFGASFLRFLGKLLTYTVEYIEILRIRYDRKTAFYFLLSTFYFLLFTPAFSSPRDPLTPSLLNTVHSKLDTSYFRLWRFRSTQQPFDTGTHAHHTLSSNAVAVQFTRDTKRPIVSLSPRSRPRFLPRDTSESPEHDSLLIMQPYLSSCVYRISCFWCYTLWPYIS